MSAGASERVAAAGHGGAPRHHSLSATMSGAIQQSQQQAQQPQQQQQQQHTSGLSSLPSRPPPSADAARARGSIDAVGMRAGFSSQTSGGPHSHASLVSSSTPNSAGGGNWNRARPASDFLSASHAASMHQPPNLSNVESIDRWFEDLQHYETTLEEMAAASLDSNFKEELSAIEQWFRVLSEAERTAALYSLLQSSTQVQMRFFITVLQQMARADPVTSLLSPANPNQQSMENQMEAKVASLSLKGSTSPVVRQFARQSLGDSYLSPHSASNPSASVPGPPSPTAANSDDPTAAATLANQRAKLKATARTSAPANLLLSAGHDANKSTSSLWSEKETLLERRSPSPGDRPRSTGSDHLSANVAHPNGAHSGLHLSHSTGPPTTASFPRSSGVDSDIPQLSPMVGGSWASMVNTPLVPMFGKAGVEPGSQMEPGNYGGNSPSIGNNTWSSGGVHNGSVSPVLVDNDVRKFRRSARLGGGGVGGSPSGAAISEGALSGMYDDRAGPRSPAGTGASQFSSMQQNAINLGLAGLQQAQQQQQQHHSSPGLGSSRLNSSGALNSPGLIAAQQAAVAAQQNWRNGLGVTNAGLGVGADTGFSPSLGSTEFGMGGGGAGQASTNAQLANLLALQQQMIQQQQQMQVLSNLAAGGMGLSPVQMMHFQQQQQALLSPGGRNYVPTSPMGFGNAGLGMNGINQARRSPRIDRSPGTPGYPPSKTSTPNPGASATVAGSGANPDEPLDMALLSDVPLWLRSLRLHKYTSTFEDSNWKEMVMLDDEGLEKKGVAALGARRKLLKVFETVRLKTNMALPGDGALNVDDRTATRSVSPNTAEGTSPDPDHGNKNGEWDRLSPAPNAARRGW
ncbi:BZ3500_MvSof-1268-A1-R1_Chr3-1g05422 [Microbotryum saponariae]|uniref:RNA-binding protein VTS1 n=1 Tax=Microbotryum saponariae TaxID=289078 RepID=A0A2X0L2C3_9BASI|nr:BZ3500_MvSof-1268-A1-R1_Chr3-1g05422 [Microbotryum saponariae]SDA04613.1 BZ3501_MvSof-1269-A2-R1_Chr3-1g05093 [Microbotryum saponariae]